MPKTITPEELEELYHDNQKCARIIGLSYGNDTAPGFGRKRRGKSFSFFDDTAKPVSDATVKKRLAELVIPPAWKEVWICPEDNGHLLVTGIDEKGRKQYIYHPKWRQVRDLLKFYRLISFAAALPKIRRTIDEHLSRRGLDYYRVMAAMLWILDNTYIRVGNDIYFKENASVGLTTLADANAIIAGSVVTLSFKGKSGKDHTITFDHPGIAKLVKGSKAIKGTRLFQYKADDGSHKAITAADINSYLQEITGRPVSAKDFRTWGGTLMAFNHLVEEQDADKKPAKIAIEAVDAAADILGNTRSIARTSYVHPHLVKVFEKKQFTRLYKKLPAKRKTGLDKREVELLQFLEMLFKQEFDLLKATK